MTKENLEKSISAVIEGMLAGAKKERESWRDNISEALDKLFTDGLEAIKDNDPCDFYMLPLYRFHKCLEGMIEEHCSNNRFVFLMMHPDYVDHHFSNLIEKIDGSACSADRCKTVLRSLAAFLAGSVETITFNYDQQYTFHLPKTVFKEHSQIVSFFDAIYSLYYGSNVKYMEFLLDLSKDKLIDTVLAG